VPPEGCDGRRRSRDEKRSDKADRARFADPQEGPRAARRDPGRRRGWRTGVGAARHGREAISGRVPDTREAGGIFDHDDESVLDPGGGGDTTRRIDGVANLEERQVVRGFADERYSTDGRSVVEPETVGADLGHQAAHPDHLPDMLGETNEVDIEDT
jgi:hypothetical protein